MAAFFRASLHTVHSWALQGMPGSKGSYDLDAICEWLYTDGPRAPKQHAALDTDDPMLAGGDSPQLERYRAAKAALAELELEERKGSLLSRDKALTAYSRLSPILLRLGESLGKMFGARATEEVNEAVDKWVTVVKDEFGGTNTPDN